MAKQLINADDSVLRPPPPKLCSCCWLIELSNVLIRRPGNDNPDDDHCTKYDRLIIAASQKSLCHVCIIVRPSTIKTYCYSYYGFEYMFTAYSLVYSSGPFAVARLHSWANLCRLHTHFCLPPITISVGRFRFHCGRFYVFVRFHSYRTQANRLVRA